MATVQRLMTAEELAQLPDDGQRHELIEGVVRTMAACGAAHGKCAARSLISLGNHVLQRNLGEVFGANTGFLLTQVPDTICVADVAFANHERAKEIGEVTGYWPGAPDLVIEAISLEDRYMDVIDGVVMWLAHGTQVVVILNPYRKEVTVYRTLTEVRHLTIEDTLDGEEVVPGWRVPVRELFASVE